MHFVLCKVLDKPVSITELGEAFMYVVHAVGPNFGQVLDSMLFTIYILYQDFYFLSTMTMKERLKNGGM